MTAVEPGLRGRRGRERRIAEEARVQSAAQVAARSTSDAGRHRTPDLSALPPLLAERGELTALVERYQRSTDGRSGQALRHVTYASVPHGAKAFLAASLVDLALQDLRGHEPFEQRPEKWRPLPEDRTVSIARRGSRTATLQLLHYSLDPGGQRDLLGRFWQL